MSLRSKRIRLFSLEVTKVLTIFLAFYLMQTQIFQVRYDIYGTASGLAEAQERTTAELGETQEYIGRAIEDSAIELSVAKAALQKSVQSLRDERERLLRVVEERTRDVESGLSARLREDREAVTSLLAAAEANARAIKGLQGVVGKDAERMKRSMIFPTVQLRGNGTVGSGVLIYSEEQPGITNAPVYTSFVLTASHVVQEVVGEPLTRGIDVKELRVPMGDDLDETQIFSARLVGFDRECDLALLRLDSARQFLYLAELMPRSELDTLDVFSPAYAVGCPLGNRPLPTLGQISSKAKVVGDQTFWMLNAPTYFGNSGGGVYQSPKFQLIGVSSMVYMYGKRNPTVVPHMGLFVPLNTIYNWLTEADLTFLFDRQPVPPKRREELVYLDAVEPSSLPSAPRP